MSDNTAKEGLRKIFVGGLNRNTTDETFRDHFQQYGDILDLIIIKDSTTKKSKGFGFVTFDSVESADRALEDRPHTIDNKEVDIKRAIPREQNTDTAHQRTKKLFVGGLPAIATEDDIIAHFHETYPEKGTVVKCEVIKNKETGASRGFAFLEMSSEDFSDLVIIDNCRPEICGKVVEVKKAEDRRGKVYFQIKILSSPPIWSPQISLLKYSPSFTTILTLILLPLALTPVILPIRM